MSTATSGATPVGFAGRIARGARLRERWHWLIPALTVATLMAPMVLTSRTFGQDWPNHLWLVWNQGSNIEALGHPNLFLQSTIAAFLPWFAFYGGTLYSLAGGLSLVLGQHPTVAYVLFWAAGITAAYVGMTWLAAQAGVRGWRMQIPGFVLVTSAYFLTNTYGRGHWPEMLGAAVIPLLAAAAVSIARSPRVRIRDAAALVGATVVFTGSHNLTLVWGSTFLAGLLLVLVVVRPPWLRLSRRRALALLGLLALAVGVNAWFLAPDIAYASRTHIAHWSTDLYFGRAELDKSDPGTVLDLFRDAPRRKFVTLNVQLPVLFLAWALAAAVVGRRLARRAEARVMVGLVVVFGAVLVLILEEWPWHALPGPWDRIQYPWRMHSYAELAAAGLVLGALVWQARMPLGRARAALTTALVGVALVAGIQSVVQIWGQPSSLPSRSEVFKAPEQDPESWYAHLDYADVSTTPYIPLPGQPTLLFPTGQGPLRSSYSASYRPQGDALVLSNLATGPNLVDVHGAKIVGHDDDGWAVLQFPPRVRPGTTVRVTVEQRRSALIWVGRALSIVSMAVLGGLLLAALLRRRRREA